MVLFSFLDNIRHVYFSARIPSLRDLQISIVQLHRLVPKGRKNVERDVFFLSRRKRGH